MCRRKQNYSFRFRTARASSIFSILCFSLRCSFIFFNNSPTDSRSESRQGVDAAWLVDLCDLQPVRDTCRFPAEQLDRVLKQLVAAGQRVAVCCRADDVPAERFQLERQPARLPKTEKFDDEPVRQAVLFPGFNSCLPGQEDLF